MGQPACSLGIISGTGLVPSIMWIMWLCPWKGAQVMALWGENDDQPESTLRILYIIWIYIGYPTASHSSGKPHKTHTCSEIKLAEYQRPKMHQPNSWRDMLLFSWKTSLQVSCLLAKFSFLFHYFKSSLIWQVSFNFVHFFVHQIHILLASFNVVIFSWPTMSECRVLS